MSIPINYQLQLVRLIHAGIGTNGLLVNYFLVLCTLVICNLTPLLLFFLLLDFLTFLTKKTWMKISFRQAMVIEAGPFQLQIQA